MFSRRLIQLPRQQSAAIFVNTPAKVSPRVWWECALASFTTRPAGLDLKVMGCVASGHALRQRIDCAP